MPFAVECLDIAIEGAGPVEQIRRDAARGVASRIEDGMARPRRRSRKKQKRAAFAFLPRSVMRDPASLGWQPIDFAITCALITKARQHLDDERHKEAFESGASGIGLQKKYDRQFKRRWERTNEQRREGFPTRAPQRHYTYKNEGDWSSNLTTGQRLKKAGSHAYRRAKKELRKILPTVPITVEITPFELLRFAHLSTNAKNLEALHASLERIIDTQPSIGALSPLISSYRLLPSGRVRIWINHEWLYPPYGKVQMPLPTRSAIATHLQLFIANIRPSQARLGSIEFASLCERIGIPTDQSTSIATRALDRGLDVVNAQADKRAIRRDAKSWDRYRIDVDDNGRLQFVADKADGPATAITKPRRVRENVSALDSALEQHRLDQQRRETMRKIQDEVLLMERADKGDLDARVQLNRRRARK